MSGPEFAAAAMSRRDLAVDLLVRPFALNFQEQIVFALGLCVGTFIVMPPFFAYLYYIRGPRYDVKLKPEERCPLPIDNQGPLDNFADRK